MGMKYFLFVLGLVALTSNVNAQNVRKANITGIVVDAENSPLASSTVMLLAAKDSVLTSFAVTDANGKFQIKNASTGAYLLKVSYVGFATQTIPVEVGDKEEIDLGSVSLTAASEVLTEVEVTSEHIPIQIKKDTIEYNADAFQTQPNAAVEDLLKKLPGVEVSSNGQIKVNGREVNKILVNGKPFF